MNRRQFLGQGLAGLTGIVACACARSTPVSPVPRLPMTPAPSSGVVTPQPALATPPRVFEDTAPGTILENEDVPGFYVRFITPFAALDPGRWQLVIKGLVDAPTTLTLNHIQRNLPFVEQSSRLKCVECWSSRATWGGFTYAALVELIKPQKQATSVRFTCEDGYFEILPITELQRERALFVTHMDGRPVNAKHGAPLRMILPWLYGYKGAKTINTLEFVAEPGDGYWPTFGNYPSEGRILPGSDTPIDLTYKPRPIAGGEITDY